VVYVKAIIYIYCISCSISGDGIGVVYNIYVKCVKLRT